MTLNLLICLKAGFPQAVRSSCLLQYGRIGFRFMRYQCAPWCVLAIAPLKLLLASEVERKHVQVRYFCAIARIDFVKVYEFLNDLLW